MGATHLPEAAALATFFIDGIEGPAGLLNPLVWYAAVTQVFFSLAICFGTLITYASYNNFNRNVYK